jgi:purine-cytosine permease-like protein
VVSNGDELETAYPELFVWWISSITFNIIFVIVASVYLYRRRKRESAVQTRGILKWTKDFAFVWILVSLLILYVVSIGQGSYVLFAAGNIAVEMLLLLYVVQSAGSRHASR